ncbi:MAG: hypothetical protein J6T43_11640 [Prevotella sp.]|nr:hypothetical protein [Prevotella sp.]
MNNESIKEIIERQGVYEIKYQKDDDVKIRHISNIMYSPKYGDNYIFAFCHEANKELTFNIEKIVSIQDYWIGILSKETFAPNNGLFLVARCGLGQGIDIEYELLALKKGDSFIGREDSWAYPIAYHYIPSFENPEGNWIKKEIIMKKWENEIIPAPEKGIPIIAYSGPWKEECYENPVSIEYCIGNGGSRVDTVVRKGDDISSMFKEYNHSGPFGWSECWDGYRILGFTIVKEYDMYACHETLLSNLFNVRKGMDK